MFVCEECSDIAVSVFFFVVHTQAGQSHDQSINHIESYSRTICQVLIPRPKIFSCVMSKSVRESIRFHLVCPLDVPQN